MPKREFHPPHIYEDNACYFLTASTRHHHAYLRTDDQRALVRDVLKAAVQDYGVTLYAWVILADHYHLLLRTGQSIPLYRFIKRLHGESAIRLNQLDQTPGRQVWYQYWDRFPRDERGFWSYFNYIHINPLKHGYVTMGEARPAPGPQPRQAARVAGADVPVEDLHTVLTQYRYSSYHYYLRKYGEEFLNDAWARYPIPDYTEYDDFPEAGARVG